MEGRVVCVPHYIWFAFTQCRSNQGLFGLPVYHIVRSDSVWNSLSLCSSSISSSSISSSRRINSSSNISSSNTSYHLPLACSAVACNVSTTAAGPGRADPIGSEANPLGRRGLIGY